MYKPDDNDIDRLSREAAEHYRAPGTPAWNALREALDKELPQEKEKKRRGFLFFFLLALGLSVAGSAVWYGARMHTTVASVDKTTKPGNSKDDTNNKPVVVEDNHTVVKDSKSKDLTLSPSTKQAPGALKENSADVHLTTDNNKDDGSATKHAANHIAGAQKIIPGSNSPAIASSSKHAPAPKSKDDAALPVAVLPANRPAGIHHPAKNNTAAIKDITAAGENKPGFFQTASSHKKQKRGATISTDQDVTAAADVTSLKEKDKNTATNDIAANNSSTDNTKESTGESKGITQTIDIPVPDTISNKTTAPENTIVSKSIAVTENKDSAKPATVKAKNKSKHDRAILLGLTGGLDLSTVKFKYSSDIGYNIGFMGGYQFSRHWSVYTGIVYTKKSYKLNGGDYHPPASYFTNWVDLQTVEGYCRMWEVPLLARYTFNPSSKTAFFASAGLSSYFMKKQAYTYSYKTGNPPWSNTSNWSDDSSFNHYFSILDLSVGFQRQIGKHMNWQIEPYAKIPLGGVGFGNIRLSSFGLNLTVQYKHPVKR